MDETLSWDPLISEVKQKVSNILAALSRLWATMLPTGADNNMQNPHFDYCRAVPGGIGIGLSNNLQKLQNRAARSNSWS